MTGLAQVSHQISFLFLMQLGSEHTALALLHLGGVCLSLFFFKVMLFGPSDASGVHVDLCSLSKHSKPTATSPGVKLNGGHKLDAHISSMVKIQLFFN